jgi:hypothetical protein
MKIYEVEITVQMRVEAKSIPDAVDQSRTMLEGGTWHDMTEVIARRVGEVEESESPIEILKRHAKRQCVHCAAGIPAAKDPQLGWVHATAEALREQGSDALRYCTAREIQDDIVKVTSTEEEL